MNKTPRTDAQLKLEAFFDGIGIVETVEVEFARELEEELIEAQAETEHKDRLIEQMREALSWQCAGCPEVDDNGDRRNCDECSVKRLLSAAERGRVMSRITITIDTEYIPDRFTGWPDASIVLKCKPKDKYKAELVADLIAGMDCFDIEPVLQSITGEINE